MSENPNIEKEKNAINAEMKTLNADKSKYANMSKKIEEAVQKLKKSKNYLSTAYKELNKNYSSKSEMATKKRKILQEQITEINNLIRKLNETILVEAKRQLGSITSKVTQKSDELQKLNKTKEA